MAIPGPVPKPRWQRIMSYFNPGKKEECWEWKIKKGAIYGQFPEKVGINKPYKTVTAHRVVYEAFWGKIPKGYTIDHLCRNKKCVNPTHLEAVEHKVNLQRALNQISTINKNKQFCKWGHEFTENNIYTPPKRPNRRYCLTCRGKNTIQKERIAISLL